MTSPKPTRQQADLADVLELVLDKGIVVNADIAITVNETELIGVEIRAAIASFETAAKYGLAFPSGTNMERVAAASGRDPLDEDTVDLGIGASGGGAKELRRSKNPPRKRPAPRTLFREDDQPAKSGGKSADGGGDASDGSEAESGSQSDDQEDEEDEDSAEDAPPEATGDAEEDDE